MNTQATGENRPNTDLSQFEFDFQGHEIRAVADINGKPWFFAKDVCAVLGYANHNETIKYHCREDGVANCYPILDSLGRIQYPSMIDEGNLYRLTIKSQKPEAKPFESWVCDEVLPSIRRHGYYVAPDAAPFGNLDPAKTPFERINANALREYNKMKPDLGYAYLVAMGVTPEYVEKTLSEVGIALPRLAKVGDPGESPTMQDLIPSFVEDWRNGGLPVPFCPLLVNRLEWLFRHWCAGRGHDSVRSVYGIGSAIAKEPGFYKMHGRYRMGNKRRQSYFVMPKGNDTPVGMSKEDYLTECVRQVEVVLRGLGAKL